MMGRLGLGATFLSACILASCGSSSSESSDSGAPGKDGGTGGGSDGTAGSSGGGSGSSGGGSGSSSGSGSSGGGSGSSGGGSGSSGGGSGSSGGGSGSSSGSTTPGADVPTYHGHINRDGFYVDSAFTKAALMGGTLKLDTSFDGSGIKAGVQVRASPVYAKSGYGGAASFYVADESDNVYAFDGSSGKMLKTVNLGTGSTGEPCFGSSSNVGIRGTPAIDTASGIMVLDAATGGGSGVTKHTIYGLKVSDLSTAWSLDVSTLSDPNAGMFSPSHQTQRSAVLIVDGIAYVAYGGFIGDCGTYHGWLVGVQTADGKNAKAWATATTLGGIWAPGGPASDGTSIYVATGNRATNASAPANWDGAFSLIRFQKGPVFSGKTDDYWVAMSDATDQDLGGSGPLVINPSGAMPYIVQLGKDGNGYLLDTTKPLGGAVSPSLGSSAVMSDEITTGPAWASISGTVYVGMLGNGAGSKTGKSCPSGQSGELVVTKVDPTNKSNPITTLWCANPHGSGAPIITTSDGTSDPILWTLGTTMTNDMSGGDNQVHAFDLVAGTSLLTSSDKFANVRHFTSPIIVSGRLFIAGDSKLYAYKP
jgi:hypothetical protein